MTTPEQSVFFGQDVAPKILAVIDESRRNVVVVTPYLDLWQHAQNAIERALKRGVDVQFIVRVEPELLDNRDLAWLLENNVKVFVAERLHAKIYMNEKTIVLSSMNMTESSALNSLEIAFLLRNQRDAQRVREYVTSSLMKIATPVNPEYRRHVPPVAPTARSQTVVGMGHCIRCGRNLVYDPTKPLCDDCYRAWAEWSNEEYQEPIPKSCVSRS